MRSLVRIPLLVVLLFSVSLFGLAPPAAASTKAERAVEAALAQVGKPYRYGANGGGAFDCSGLTFYAWQQAGVTIPRVSSQQFAQLPRVSNPRPGDIVAFRTPVSHVAIYIGDGRMVEAAKPGVPVRIASVNRSNIRGYVRPNG